MNINVNDPRELVQAMRGVAGGIQQAIADAQAKVGDDDEFQSAVMHSLRALGDGVTLLMHSTATGCSLFKL